MDREWLRVMNVLDRERFTLATRAWLVVVK
jgi:hypothetical protein